MTSTAKINPSIVRKEPRSEKKPLSHRQLGAALKHIDSTEKGRKQRRQIMKLGELIRQIRVQELQVNQTKAAKLVGMEQPELSRIENGIGIQGPSFVTIARIIEAYESYMKKKNTSYQISLSLNVAHGASETKEINLLSLNG